LVGDDLAFGQMADPGVGQGNKLLKPTKLAKFHGPARDFDRRFTVRKSI
jgi:hypothetical protein